MENDKLALRASNGGIRFIAQMTIYNGGNIDRLRQYIIDSYHENLLAEEPIEKRLEDFQTLFRTVGRMKVKQVAATNKETAVVIAETEKEEGFYFIQLEVEEEYPHKIIKYLCVKMREVPE